MKWALFNSHKITRNAPDGGAGAAPTADAAPAAPAATAQPPVATQGPDLSFIPSDFHVEGKPDLGKFVPHYQELVADAAKRAERAALVPQDGNYAYDLPADLKFDGLELPPGFKITNVFGEPEYQPLVADLSAMLKDVGAPAEMGGKIAVLVARKEAIDVAEATKAFNADMAQLGTAAQQQARIETLGRNLQAKLPADQAESLLKSIRSSAAVKALETLLTGSSLNTPAPAPNSAPIDPLAARYPNTPK